MNASRILVVDDDPRNTRLLESLLTSAGYEVLKAAAGKEACRRVASDRPDLVLLDAMMPEMNGFEVCSWIRDRAETSLLPVVMVTALNATEDKVRALDIGADDFLTKPINRLELLAKVKSLLRVRWLQKDLEAKNEELRRAEQLRESLLQMIVHDLKNPLAGIQGSVDLLMMSHLAHTPDARRLARSMRTSCRNMMGMILDMLDVGRMEGGHDVVKPEEFDLSSLVAEDVDECLGLARAAEVELAVETPAPGPRAMADAGLIRRVVANLLNNAIKHTPPGGRVTIGTRTNGDQIEVRVGDTGEGIPREELERIFQKFARVSGQSRSTRQDRGLGLTFCRMAIEAHGGKIIAESDPGHGSTFTFTIPAAPELAAVPAGERA